MSIGIKPVINNIQVQPLNQKVALSAGLPKLIRRYFNNFSGPKNYTFYTCTRINGA